MILSEHALKGNGDKLVKEFLSTLESATSWLDIRIRLAVESWPRAGAMKSFQKYFFEIFCNADGKLLICLSCQL